MTEDRAVTLRLPPDLLARLTDAARGRNCAPADVIRAALAGYLAIDRQPTLPTLALISAVAQAATGWHDLLRGLRQSGAVLRQDCEGMLWLHSWPADRPLGPASLWNLDLRDLALRFGAPFPGACRTTGLPVSTDARPPTANPMPVNARRAPLPAAIRTVA